RERRDSTPSTTATTAVGLCPRSSLGGLCVLPLLGGNVRKRTWSRSVSPWNLTHSGGAKLTWYACRAWGGFRLRRPGTDPLNSSQGSPVKHRPVTPPAASAVPVGALPVEWCRGQFPALARQVAGQPAIFFDGPAGSQVPECVIDAIDAYLRTSNANHGGLFVTSRESDALLETAHQALAHLFVAPDPTSVVFGANMTTLTCSLSRALARTWQAGAQIVVTRLDHDANVTPWVLAARDAGAAVHHLAIHPQDCTLDLDDLRRRLSPRTRLVAVGAASNAVGTIHPVA